MAPTRTSGAIINGVDLKSARATRTCKVTFKPWEKAVLPIVGFACTDSIATCIMIKKWLMAEISGHLGQDSHDLIRMDCLELDKIPPRTHGTLLMLEDIATTDGSSSDGAKVPVGILGLFIPREQRVRWFYSILSFSTLLLELEHSGVMTSAKVWEPTTRKHRSLHVFVVEAFQRATTFPDHPDFSNAMSITDYATEICEPENALSRLLCHDLLQQSKDGLDLEDDRYLLRLHNSERHLAALLELHCAEYLLVKRTFFKDFYIAVYRSGKKIKNGEKVRTDHAHQKYLEDVYGWAPTRARKLVAGWRTLGLLQETGFLKWATEGGMLSHDDYEEEEEEEEAAEEDEQDEE